MPGDGPEYHGQRGREGRDEDADPDGASEEELADVGLLNGERPEWCGLRLAEED